MTDPIGSEPLSHPLGRRRFMATLAGGLLTVPLAAGAQQAKEVPRIGYLLPNANRPTNEAFWAGLRDLGYVEAQNVTIERRYADGNSQRYPTLAAELVRLRVNMIVADGAEATSAARQATATIPIVMIAAEISRGCPRMRRISWANGLGCSRKPFPTFLGWPYWRTRRIRRGAFS